MATTSITGFDTSSLLNYYSAQLSQASANTSARTTTHSSTSSKSTSATAKDVTPWATASSASSTSRAAQVLALSKFIDTSAVPTSAGIATDTKMEQDNQKLFALYNAINNLSYLAVMAKSSDSSDGQRAGYNTRFQAGLKEISSYISSASFNLFALQAQSPSSSVTSTATVAMPTFDYTGSVVANSSNITSGISGLTKSDSFTIAMKKGGVTTNLNIDLSQISGDLTMGNIVTYVNQQLSAGGFSTRFKKNLVSGSEDTTDGKKATAQYALQIVPGGTEQISLSANSTPALYLSGTSGLTTASTSVTTTSSTSTVTTAADSQGRITKLTDFSASNDPTAEYSRTVAATKGTAAATTSATATVVDSSGNVYMLGNSSGDIGSQINQGSQDVYLTKYDSAGKALWSKLVGSGGTADGASMALNPSGGVVVVGSTTAKLSTTAVANGTQDSFAVKYDGDGNQVWTTQIQTLNANGANAVSVDSSGNVYIGGQTRGVIGLGQTTSGGQDAYLAKLDSKGKLVYEKQFGTSASDSVSATATTADGSLYVASVQNGHAIVSKYADGDATKAATWSMDMGDLQYGGTVGGLVVKDNGDGTSGVYVSGTTRNGSLNATAANSASGGTDAYLFKATDNGSSVTANKVTYIGTSANESGAGLALGSDGTVYMTGSTAGTFAGQTRSQDKTTNMFVASVKTDGSIGWVNQYGGADGQSTGTGIAIDNSGASVLDALGLPSGKVQGQANADLTSATTLRAGDFFKVALQGDGARTFTITIDKGETLNSLVTKINAQFGSKGKASINYTGKGAALKLEVSEGVTAKLVAGTTDSVVVAANKGTGTAAKTVSGSSDFDALAALGIAPQTLYKAASSSSKTSSSTSSSSTSSSSKTYSLGMPSISLDISTTTGAGAARAQLLTVLSAIQNVYQQSNTTASTASTSTASTANSSMSAAATAYNNSLNAKMSLALNLLSA